MQYPKKKIAATFVAACLVSSSAHAEGPGWFGGLFKKKENKAVSTKAPSDSDVTRAATTRELLARKKSEREYQNNVIRKVTDEGGDAGTDPLEEQFSFLKGSGFEGITISYGAGNFMFNGKSLDEFLYKNKLGESAIAGNSLFNTGFENSGLEGYSLIDSKGNPIEIVSKSKTGLGFLDSKGNPLTIASDANGITYVDSASGKVASFTTTDGTHFFDSNGEAVTVLKKSGNDYIVSDVKGNVSTFTKKNGVKFVNSKGKVIDAQPIKQPGFQMNAIQAALYASAIQYFAETPLLGGNPERGFYPKIWPAMVKVAFENRLVMLPSGELLYPADPEFKYMVSGQSSENSRRVNLTKAHVIVTDHSGNIVGENFQPINVEALEDADGNALAVSKMSEEAEEYSNGFKTFNLFGAMTLNPNVDMSPFMRRAEETARMDKIEGPRQTWIGCVGKLFRGIFSAAKRAEAHECFKLNKDQAMAEATTPGTHEPFIKDLAVGMGRGALSGLGVTAVMGGLDLGGGAMLGAVMNGMRVAYNRFFKKEVITNDQIRQLANFVDKYTFAPNAYGEVMPRKGAWMVRDNATIIRYQTMAGFRRNNKTGEDVAAEANILLDINGNPRKANAGLRIDNITANVKALGRDNPEDFQRQREAMKQVRRLAEIQEAKRAQQNPAQNPALPILK